MMVVRRIVAVMLSLAFMSVRAGADGRFESARFRESEGIERYLVIPSEGSVDSLNIPCEAVVSIFGGLEGPFCYIANERQIPFADAIQLAARKAKLNPASVNGKRKPVLMHFNVKFNATDNGKRVDIKLHQGQDEAIYGSEYIAPQLVLPISFSAVPHGCFPRNEILWVQVLVSSDGRALKGELFPAATPENCREKILGAYMNAVFVPGFDADRALDAHYVEGIYPSELIRSK